MLKSVLAAALAAGLVVALAPPGLAGSEIRLAQAAPSKPLTPQQRDFWAGFANMTSNFGLLK
jgi:hypothetical protein